MKDIKKLKRFCSECGNKMILKEKRIAGYNTTTGKPIYHRDFVCSKRNEASSQNLDCDRLTVREYPSGSYKILFII